MGIIKMITSGLVQLNYGYGTFPASYKADNTFTYRPANLNNMAPIDYEKESSFRKPMPKTVYVPDKYYHAHGIVEPPIKFSDIFS